MRRAFILSIFVSFVFCLFVLGAILLLGTPNTASVSQITSSPELSSLEAPFIPNYGQVDDSVVLYAHAAGGTVFVTCEGGIVYSFPSGSQRYPPADPVHPAGPSGAAILSEELVGASNVTVEGKDISATRVSVYKGADPGNWQRDLATYRYAALGKVYPGIDLALHADGDRVEKIFTVSPEGDVSDIQIQVLGVRSLVKLPGGELEAVHGSGAVRFSKPSAYQVVNSVRRIVPVSYTASEKNYGFTVSEYDRSQDLIIDPVLYATYLGGTSTDEVTDLVATGDAIYAAGWTMSADFPASVFDTTYGSGIDGFIARMSDDLTTLHSAVYLGGSQIDEAYALAVNGTGVYVSGMTASMDFPGGSSLCSYYGNGSGFVSRFSGDLTSLVYTRCDDLGRGNAIALDSAGNVLLAGASNYGGFPTTTGVFQTQPAGNGDATITKLSPGLDTILASTWLGGTEPDEATAVALSSSGNVVIAGWTSSGVGTTTFPTGWGSLPYGGGSSDAFVAVLDEDLTTLEGSTFLGGSDEDEAHAVHVNSSGVIFVGGSTLSDDFPASVGDTTFGSATATQDGFIARLDSSGQLTDASYLGGDSQDLVYDVIEDQWGDLFIGGLTYSADFPITSGAYRNIPGWGFVTNMASDFTTINASTFFPAEVAALDLDGEGDVVLGGRVGSTPDYPATMGAFDRTHNGGTDGFVTVMTADLAAAPAYSVTLEVDPPELEFEGLYPGDTSQGTLRITNAGSGELSITSFTHTGSSAYSYSHNCLTILPASDWCEMDVVFSTMDEGLHYAILTINSNDLYDPVLDVPLVGTCGYPRISVSPTTVDFGPVVAYVETSRPLTITNTGLSKLIVGITKAGPFADAFKWEYKNDSCYEIQPGGICELIVGWCGTEVGFISADLILANTDPDQQELKVEMKAVASPFLPVGGGGGCNTVKPAVGAPLWVDLFWMVILGGILLYRRKKVSDQR